MCLEREKATSPKFNPSYDIAALALHRAPLGSVYHSDCEGNRPKNSPAEKEELLVVHTDARFFRPTFDSS